MRFILKVLFSRVSFVLMLQADLMKGFVVFSLLNCQGFLDMEKRVCGYFVCVVRCVCVCAVFQKAAAPLCGPAVICSALRWSRHMEREQEPCLVSANGMVCYQGSR